jgi:ornithine cyclodeaminase/alanine dehydrogenase-like protein (mu-crystallin family)
VLRTKDEPCEYYEDQRVHELLTRDPGDFFRYTSRQLLDIAENRSVLELPPKQIFSDPAGGGDFRVMPCVVTRDRAARKTVKIVGTNLAQKVVSDQITVGKAMVVHPTDNYISHVFEACLLSSARTGMCAAQAAERIIFCDLDADRARAAAAVLAWRFPGLTCDSLAWSELGETDVLVLSTNSRRALHGPDDFAARLIISLGADTDDQSELRQEWAGRAELYVDTLDSARYGDLRRWPNRGLTMRIPRTWRLSWWGWTARLRRPNRCADHCAAGCPLP